MADRLFREAAGSRELTAGAALSDESLMDRLQSGDRQAFRYLVERHYGPLRAYALRLLASPDAADDLTQETFLRMLESAHQFDTTRRFKPWMYQIARNHYRDRLRSAEHRRTTPTDTLPEQASPASPVEHRLVRSENRRQVREALQQLDPRAREALLLRFQGEFSIREIAGMLDVPEGTVKSRIYYGLKKLGQQLEDPVGPQASRSRGGASGG